MATKTITEIHNQLEPLLLENFVPNFNELKFPSKPIWKRFRHLGTSLWFNSADPTVIGKHWTGEFSGLTVSNSFLDHSIQTGEFDQIASQAARAIKRFDISDHDKLLEMNFALSAVHALDLIQKFDAFVAVDLHSNLSNDLEQMVEYGKRMYQLCPERMIVNIPLTPAGMLAARRLSDQEVPVNLVFGSSARQNYISARICNPAFVNVHLGDINNFIKRNMLGEATFLGEKVTIASFISLKHLRDQGISDTVLVGTDISDHDQVFNMVGVNILNFEPDIAAEVADSEIVIDRLSNKTGVDYQPDIDQGYEELLNIGSLWQTEQEVYRCCDLIEKENLDSFTPDDLRNFFHDHQCGDIFPKWSAGEIAASAREDFPQLEHWQAGLTEGTVGLDALLALYRLNRFADDQAQLDQRIWAIWDAAGE